MNVSYFTQNDAVTPVYYIYIERYSDCHLHNIVIIIGRLI